MSGLPGAADLPPLERRIFCNRTLNLRAIRAIGYDMDYTLIHYRVEEWERRAYERTRNKLLEQGWPVGELQFDSDLVIRGLVIDRVGGNLLKPNRFGYVVKAFHGTRPLPFEDQRRTYSRTMVDLSEPRFVFLNTLFSLSEACLWTQLVDLLDRGAIPEALGYSELYDRVKRSLDQTHMEGELKAEIARDPRALVLPDPEAALALLDQRRSGKRLLLITNSEWSYTRSMMAFAFDPYLPDGLGWRDLFDFVIVSARKPSFFVDASPLFEVVNDEGMLVPKTGNLEPGKVYYGGNAALLERSLGVSGSEILYVGDHLYVDVRVSKSVLRWRTALVLRELEAELAAVASFREDEARLVRLMAEKERLEFELSRVRLALQRESLGYGPRPRESRRALEKSQSELRASVLSLDQEIAPLARRSGEIANPRWGPLFTSGSDKSHLARQVERYADIYLSRVSNFLHHTPFLFLRARRGTLPHDAGVLDLPGLGETSETI